MWNNFQLTAKPPSRYGTFKALVLELKMAVTVLKCFNSRTGMFLKY